MSFRSIYGHEKQIRGLRGALEQNRVPHAYLFSGMPGIGKKIVAAALAKKLNCTGAPASGDTCDVCASCLKMDHGTHPDLVFIEPEGQFIRIKAIRDLQAQMQYNPLEGRCRVIIIDDADRMNITSANALLKTIEEPAARNHLVLITGNPSGLPRTILSRCQQVRFSPLHRDTIAACLKTRHSLPEGDATMIAGASGGSLAQALELAREGYKNFRDRTLNDLIAVLDHDIPTMLSFSADFGKERDEVTKRLNILRSCFRDALVYRETGESGTLINCDRPDIITNLARRFSGKDLLNHLRTVAMAVQAVEQNANKALTLEAMMFKLAH